MNRTVPAAEPNLCRTSNQIKEEMMKLKARVFFGVLAIAACSAAAAQGSDARVGPDPLAARLEALPPGDNDATTSTLRIESAPPLRRVALQVGSAPPSGGAASSQRAQDQPKRGGRLAGHPGAIAGIVIGSMALVGAMSNGGGGGMGGGGY
jgi:hypothetical protein